MKIKSLELKNYRGFDHFELHDLGLVNLLVGTNNCGKTTILEAIKILMSDSPISGLWQTLAQRDGEVIGDSSRAGRQLEIRRLFQNHEIALGKSFELSASTDHGEWTMLATIERTNPDEVENLESEPDALLSPEDFLNPRSLSLQWRNPVGGKFPIPLTRQGGISRDAIQGISRHVSPLTEFAINFITASSLSADEVSRRFEEIVLTPEEDLVTEALRIIEPSIERIAVSGSDRSSGGMVRPSRGRILVRLKGSKERIPISSMGDGIWRLLGLALSVVRSAGGILLVDEIDAGLHYTVMQEMWQFLYQCAKKYDVQIIATTHSRDCYHSLAVICRDDVSEGSEVTINRIERDRSTAISYSEQEIVAAANVDIEVR